MAPAGGAATRAEVEAAVAAQVAPLLERVEGALMIPASAVREGDGQRYVYKLEDGVVTRRTVQVGQMVQPGNLLQASGTLAAGANLNINMVGYPAHECVFVPSHPIRHRCAAAVRRVRGAAPQPPMSRSAT